MRKLVAVSCLGFFAFLTPARADAHFKLNAIDHKMPVSWMSQDTNGGPQKTAPCAATVNAGETAGKTTGVVTDVKAGQMVSLTVQSTIAHTGWFRVALVEGSSASQTLSTLPDPKGSTCVPAIVSNPVWSTTQPVIGDGLPAGSTDKTNQAGTQMLKVTIPSDASCTTAKPCTLQVIMVMTDHQSPDCYYHHCADITVAAAAGNGSGGAGGGSGAGGQGGAKAAGGGSGTSSGGVQGSGGSTASGGDGGGVAATGGSTGSGGAPGSGGSSASGGSTSTGGATSSGGALATGGTTSSGGKSGSGGSTGSGGSSSASGSGGAGSPGATDTMSGCACAVADDSGRPLTILAALLFAALVTRRRAR